MHFSESLKKNKDFQIVYRKGQSYANKYLVMYIYQNQSERNRLGISVSKKVGNSVVRHRLTRLIRESYRLQEDKFQNGLDIVIIARAGAKGRTYKEIESALIHLGKLHELEWFPKWKETRLKWHKALGFGDDHYRFHDHDKLAHYANAATDIEFLMPFGFKEVEGIHSRTNFDLSQHEKFSGKSIKYFDPELNESYTPYVIETSIGVDRMFLSIMSAAYTEETLENGETRVVLKLPAALAPVKLAVMPLVKKDGLPEKAREITDTGLFWICS